MVDRVKKVVFRFEIQVCLSHWDQEAVTCGIHFLYVFEIETVREGNERRDIAEMVIGNGAIWKLKGAGVWYTA